MDLQGEPRKLIVEYSHGMKKKLSLACALIHRPKILFLDEPFEGVDAIASRTLKDLSLKTNRTRSHCFSHLACARDCRKALQ